MLIARQFNQAVFGEEVDVLANIQRPDINLAVWQRTLPAVARDYFDGLDLSSLWTIGSIRPGMLSTIMLGSIRSDKLALCDDPETQKYFLEQAALLPGCPEQRRMAADEIQGLCRAFAKATGLKGDVNFNLNVFDCSTNVAPWHVDSGKYVATSTLTGQMGTLWLPDGTIKIPMGFRSGYLEDLKPEKYGEQIQQIPVHDLSVMKGTDFSNPLVHASPGMPFVDKLRLTLVAWQM